MSNLSIKDFKTLETLSLDELDRVVGGRGRGKGVHRNKCWSKWFNYGGTDAVILSPMIETIMEAISEGDKVTLVGF